MLYCRELDEDVGKKLTDAELCDRLLWVDVELFVDDELRWLLLLLLDELKEEPEKLDPDAAILLLGGINNESKMMKTAVLKRTAFFI